MVCKDQPHLVFGRCTKLVQLLTTNQHITLLLWGPCFVLPFPEHICPSFSVVSKSNLILLRALFAHKYVPYSFSFFTLKTFPTTAN